jgi:hypothetical protein
VFQTASKTSSQAAPAEPIDINQRYIVQLMSLRDEGVSKFADKTDPEPEHSIKWILRIHQLDKTPMLTIDDEPYELWEWTSSRTGKDPSGKTPTAKARLWIEAFMGRAVEDEEIKQPGFEQQLIHKPAFALFEEKARQGQDGQENTRRLRVLRLSPYVEKTPAAPAAPVLETPAPTPKPAVEALPFR